MKIKIFVFAAIICTFSLVANDVQAMTNIVNNGVEVEEYGLKIRRRVIVRRRVAPRIVVAPVVVINNNRYYRHRCPPPPPPPRSRHWRCYW